ncbi:hypothetical protein PISMIDRAFT_686226 [Pisolithus microcarpus 441]|uniref:Uncharacterized protein n=1 Tax=Pisolithus microcarpus 441 TaxID=765257 RepID=A0A0C9XVJ2_9AGAM|nr:hypothetical protein PISMIDRAFT_686226 [Pisolithus microcarpus 441]
MAFDTASSTEHFNNWPKFEVIHEERQPIELTVSGHIPSYVSGTCCLYTCFRGTSGTGNGAR